MYKNIIFFSVPFITEKLEWVMHKSVGDGQNAHTERRPFCFIIPGSKSSQVYMIFETPTQSLWSRLPPMRCTWTRLLSSTSPTQLMWYFRRRNTCVLFALGNRCISSYATHATYAACQRNLLVSIQHLIKNYIYKQDLKWNNP